MLPVEVTLGLKCKVPGSRKGKGHRSTTTELVLTLVLHAQVVPRWAWPHASSCIELQRRHVLHAKVESHKPAVLCWGCSCRIIEEHVVHLQVMPHAPLQDAAAVGYSSCR